MPATITSQHLQDSVLVLAITDTEFLGLIAGQVRPEHFSSRLTERLVRICLDYYGNFKQAPQDHFNDELVRSLRDHGDDERREFAEYVKRVRLLTPNKPYVVRRLNDFVKAREYEQAAIEFADDVAAGEFDAAQNRMYAALKAGIQQEDVGLKYFHDLSGIARRSERPEYVASTGLASLDRKIGGYRRGQLVVYLGGPKGMKTWALMHVGANAVLEGRKVLHVSHEVSQEEMELRYDMMFGWRGTWQIGETVEYAFLGKDDKLEHTKAKVRSVYDSESAISARARATRYGGDLIIKKYPQYQCSCGELERYLNYLETFEGWVPDIVLNDYADIMKPDNGQDQLRHQINRIYNWMKGVADDRNILVVTASQVNRQAIKRKFVRMTHVAEDIRKVANCDVMLAVCQTDEDERSHIARLAVLANRSGRQDVYCTFSTCLHIGQFAISSWDSEEVSKEVMEMFGQDEEKEE